MLFAALSRCYQEAFYYPTNAWRLAVVTRGLAALAETADHLRKSTGAVGI